MKIFGSYSKFHGGFRRRTILMCLITAFVLRVRDGKESYNDVVELAREGMIDEPVIAVLGTGEELCIKLRERDGEVVPVSGESTKSEHEKYESERRNLEPYFCLKVSLFAARL